MKQNLLLNAFNRGLVSRLGIGRIDIKRLAMSAEIMVNWMPRVLGSMMLRCGLKYIGSSKDDLPAVHIPFVFSTDDTAIIELTDQNMRVRVSDALIERESVDTVIQQETFSGVTDFSDVTAAGIGSSTASFSVDGQFYAQSETVGSIEIYAYANETFTPITSLSLGAGLVARDVRFSNNGQFMAVGLNNSPYIKIWSISGSTFTALPLMASPPSKQVNSIDFSDDGNYLAVGTLLINELLIYSISGTTFTEITPLSSGVIDDVNEARFNVGSTLLACAHVTSPYVTVYQVINASTFTKLSSPAILPPDDCECVAFSPNGLLLTVGHDTTPFITNYKINGTTLTKLTNPSSIPEGIVYKVRYSPSSKYLIVGLDSPVAAPNDKNLVVYEVSGTSITKIPDPATMPATSVFEIAWLPNSGVLMAGSKVYRLNVWQDLDDGAATSTIGGSLTLNGTGSLKAIRDQLVFVKASNFGDEHSIKIQVERGTAYMRIGSTVGDDDVMSETLLRAGVHSLVFTPSSNFYLRFFNQETTPAVITSVEIESSGIMELAAPWLEDALQNIRWKQSGDVIFIACEGYQQQRIERQSDGSWSIVEYQPIDGPFRTQNLTGTTLTPSAIEGHITIEASEDVFKSGNVGGLYKISSIGQQVTSSLNGANQFTDPIRVTGIGNGRVFARIITGTWSGTVQLQRAAAEPVDWVDVGNGSTGNINTTYDDNLDNQVMYYRAGFKTGEYTSGTAVVSLFYTAGSIDGVVKITEFIDEQNVEADVVVTLGGTAATNSWAEGDWSDRRGWPTAVTLHDGRLWWAGKDKIWGSVSDGYDSFDPETVGDAGPISRSIGIGPVDRINWLLATTNLLIGAEGAEMIARSSTLDEPLTPTGFSIKPVSTQGSNDTKAVEVDTSGIFVHRNGSRVYELTFDGASYNYASNDLTAIIPEIGKPGIRRIAVQRQPDTRIHFVRSDGTVAVLVYDKVESVTCWVEIETDGEVEDVIVLPNTTEDDVYYHVKRTIDGDTKRYLEKFAYEENCRGGAINNLADSYITYSGASTATITGLSHLEGETVCVWGNSKDLGTYTVTSGSITLSEAVTQATIGLVYTAQYKSSKLALSSAMGVPITQRKRIDHLALLLADTHEQGLQYGSDFDRLYDLPQIERGTTLDEDYIWEAYDQDSFVFDGSFDTDSRMCLQAQAPRPVTILATVISADIHDKG